MGIDACMVKNKNLGKYDFKYNNITEPGYKRLIEVLTKEDGSGSHVFDVELPERIDDKEVFAEFRTALAGNKPSKKKKRKRRARKSNNKWREYSKDRLKQKRKKDQRI